MLTATLAAILLGLAIGFGVWIELRAIGRALAAADEAPPAKRIGHPIPRWFTDYATPTDTRTLRHHHIGWRVGQIAVVALCVYSLIHIVMGGA